MNRICALGLVLCIGATPSWGFCPFGQRPSKTLPSQWNRKLEDEGLTPMESPIPEASDTSNPLVVANENFHVNYDQAKEDMVPQTNILPESDYLVLHLQNGSRIKEHVNTMYYHNLKMVSHLPLNAYVILLANTTLSVHLSMDTMGRLEEFLDMLHNITLNRSDFISDDQYQRQLQIYDDTVSFVTALSASEMCSYDAMVEFASSMSAATQANLDDAAEIQMNTTHEIVMRWKENVISPSEWASLYTVTASGHLVAQDFSFYQYFQRLFGTAKPTNTCGEYHGWEYYDNKTFNLGGSYPYEEDLADDVATHYVDFNIGQDFFHDLHRMHRDALADGATKALNKIFGSIQTSNYDDDMIGDDDDCVGCENVTTIIIGLLCLLQVISLFVIGFTCYQLRKANGEIDDPRDVKNTEGFSLTSGAQSSSGP